MSRILVASTIPAFAMNTPHWGWWLANAEDIEAHTENAGHHVGWFAACQHDARGIGIFAPLLHRLQEVPHGDHLAFSLDIGTDAWTSGTRLAGIVTGRNLIIDHAIRHLYDWVYFADADIEAPDDVLVRLLELDWPVVGAHVPTYCLHGPRCDRFPQWDVQTHWNTAGSLLVRRDVFRRVPWRIDPDAGETDDPATQAEMARLGWPTLVRHDVLCRHHPETIGAFEHRGLDRTVYR